MTDTTICGAGQGLCNDLILGEFLLLKEIVNCSRYQAATELVMALREWCAPHRAPQRREP